jgi:serine/threonine protein kinase
MPHVCNTCWATLAEDEPECADCHSEQPQGGWPALPHAISAQYQIESLLGKGGMAAVYLAKNVDDPLTPVAVKVPRAHLAQRELVVRMFASEQRAAAFLAGTADRFVQVLGYSARPTPLLVLECLRSEEGWKTLDRLAPTAPGHTAPALSEGFIAQLAVEVLLAIEVMEASGIVHNDLKPTNLFFRETGDKLEVKVGDLGVWTRDARKADGTAFSQTPVPVGAGTIAYMSPELLRGEQVTSASDLHALGSILWELATSTLPFPSVRDQRLVAMTRRLERPPTMSQALFSVLSRALAHTPGSRFSSATEMKQAIRRSLLTPPDPVASAVSVLVQALDQGQVGVEAKLSPLLPLLRPRPRRAGMALIVIVVTLAAVAGWTLFLQQRAQFNHTRSELEGVERTLAELSVPTLPRVTLLGATPRVVDENTVIDWSAEVSVPSGSSIELHAEAQLFWIAQSTRVLVTWEESQQTVSTGHASGTLVLEGSPYEAATDVLRLEISCDRCVDRGLWTTHRQHTEPAPDD